MSASESDHLNDSIGDAFPTMQVRNQRLYSRCLFKTIDFRTLQSELLARSVQVSCTDSFGLLTLKLRLELLIESDVNPEIIEQLRSEISLETRSKNSYKCCLIGCPFKTVNHRMYIKHLQNLHSNTKQMLECQFRGCKRQFIGVRSLEVHLKVAHSSRKSMVQMKHQEIVENVVELKCLQISCHHQITHTMKELKKHLNSHFLKKETVGCIFEGCKFETDISGSLRDHFSKKHRNLDINHLNPDIISDFCGDIEIQCTSESSQVQDLSVPYYQEESHDIELDEQEELFEDCDTLNIFLRSLSVMFNDWMNVKHIPYTTCNVIVKEVFDSYIEGKDVLRKKLKKILEEMNISEQTIKDIVEELSTVDPFDVANQELGSEYKRLNYLKENFNYNDPEIVHLDSEKKDSYIYIPIDKSLQRLVEDATYISQKETDPYVFEDGVYSNVRDGKYFRTNPYFTANPNAIPIMLFQDELEIVNPLGSGKTKHKLNMTYFTTYEVQAQFRSKVQSIQLVSIVPSRIWKQYGNLLTNSRLVMDLKLLESDGIKVMKPREMTVKAGLAVIVGDNLGLHQIAEHNSCFSSGYICRVCQATYEQVCNENLLYCGIEEGFHPANFTNEVYDESARAAVENGGASRDTLGIKAECVFNSLLSFHCSTAMPPCLGHDFFEGWYQVLYFIFLIFCFQVCLVTTFNFY